MAEQRPWTPVEAEPAEVRAPAPDTVPVVVQSWTLTETGEARPDRPTTGGLAATLKRDASRFRALRFAEAWRLLRERGRGWLYDPKATRTVALSGALVSILRRRR